MVKKSIISKLYNLNMHLGHQNMYNSRLNYYILGKRFGFFVMDMNKSFVLLKKVIYLLSHLSRENGTLLFYYSKFTSLSILYRCVLLSISKHCNQQMITYNWIYGSISNFFFSFFYLISDLTHTWLSKTRYVYTISNSYNTYYNVNNTEEKMFSYVDTVYNRLQHNPLASKTMDTKYYNDWYTKWVKQQTAYSLYKYKKNALYQTTFLKQLCFYDINNILKKKKLLNFKFLFLKLFYYINKKKEDPYYAGKYDTSSEEEIHSTFLSYWRFLLYFKYFNNYFQVPDALFAVFPDNNVLPVNEYSSSGCISIGLIDTTSTLGKIQYPIISNDDSLLIVCFFFSLFSNIFLEQSNLLYKALIT